jgi:nucleotide-binding universal stress UspA family protein
MRVLLAVDASPDSRNAARVVQHLAEPPLLDVLNVVDEDALKHAYISRDIPARYLETYRAEVTEVAERVLHEMKQELEGQCRHIRLIADVGDAAESIIETAEESRSDLIIVGQRGITASPTFLLGGVSQKVATYASSSVLVVKGSADRLERVIVAVDGSAESHKVVEFLAGAPFKGPLQVIVVTAWPQRRQEPIGLPFWAEGRAELKNLVDAKGAEFLKRISAELGKSPYTVETEVLHGDPAFVILDAAVRYDAQMVLLGSRGTKGIKRFLLGSVCQKVLPHADCSVLIVR